jgi:Matrixin
MAMQPTRRIMLTLATALAATHATPAHALVMPREAPATHYGADTMLWQAVGQADAYWRSRGLTQPPVDLYVADLEHDHEAAAPIVPSSRVWVDRWYRDSTWLVVTDRAYRTAFRRKQLAELCATLVHERGHNLGFGHVAVPSSVMYSFRVGRVVPARCVGWACRALPRKRPKGGLGGFDLL